MGVVNFNDEIISAAAPAKLFKALVIDSDTLIPKTIPDIKSVEVVEGNGGPGSIKKLTFVEDGETKHVLHKVEVIDEANLVYHYSIIGGAGLPESVEKISFQGKIAEGTEGGSIAIISVTFHTKGDATPTEEEVIYGKVKNDGIFKALEGYVLANPDYN